MIYYLLYETKVTGEDNCNYFVEVLRECVTSIKDITGQQLNANECLWVY